ncbi:hypothetical protein SAMN05880593_118113 [Rhizobium sp. RU36D]|nr:hypothetical protein SAMN05880593_118113 [Rhizobium sp. RU36D]
MALTTPHIGMKRRSLLGAEGQKYYGNTDQAIGWSQLAGVTLCQHAQCA